MVLATDTMKARRMAGQKMRTAIVLVGLGLALSACATTTTGSDVSLSSETGTNAQQSQALETEADGALPENTLRVRFEPNSELAVDQCNPKIHFALRTAEDVILINANFEVVDQSITGSGLALFDQDGSGIANNSTDLNLFDPYPVACEKLQIRVQDLSCRLEDEQDSAPCPNPTFEGTEMFASFRGLPDY